MLVDPQLYADRRARYLAGLGEAAALLVSPPHATRNADSEYRFRQSSDLLYLTGWADPEALALLRPGSELPFILFVQPKRREQEVWTGRRAGVEGAREHFGADAAFPISELTTRLGTLLTGYSTLHHQFGADVRFDHDVLGAIRGAARLASRNGAEVPWQFVEPGRLIGELRLYKSPAELDILREAARITCEAHTLAMATGRPGAFEYEVEAAVDGHFRRAGGTGPGYTTIVGGGDNANILHYIENKDPLVDGTLCLVDAGCEVRGFTADVTRTWPVGGRFSGPQRAMYEVVLRAQLAAIDAARPGRPYKDMHDAAVRVLTEGMVSLKLLEGAVDELVHEGAFTRYYMHGTGHWLGLDVHDSGAYHLGFAARPLEPGMVLTVEPGLYVPADDDRAPAAFRGIGIRIEDDLVITAGAPEVLTAACPKRVDDVEAACRR